MSIAPEIWLSDLLGVKLPPEGTEIVIRGARYSMQHGVLRAQGSVASEVQSLTERSFSYIWDARDRFQSDEQIETFSDWYRSMYGDIATATWWSDYGERPLLVEAGCGAGMSALGLFGNHLHRVRYLGVDISTAVDTAAERFADKQIPAAFLQTDLMQLPVDDGSIDVIFSQGVLHHTDSTRDAVLSLARKLRAGGRLLFYVYRKKGPIREFTDDYIRGKLRDLSPKDVWETILPLTKFGKALAELDIEIDVPEPIDLLEIPAGKINLQRLFYWHVLKAFHRPDWNLDELNHVNVDWYSPANAHRHTVEEVRDWCRESRLAVEREHVQESGITIIARKSE